MDAKILSQDLSDLSSDIRSSDFNDSDIFKRLNDAYSFDTNLENKSLSHAEAVIENQHSEILSLTNDVNALNTKLKDNLLLHNQTQNKLVNDINKLNDHVAKLESELHDAVVKSDSYLDTIGDLENKISRLDNLLLSKDSESNQFQQLNHKYKIRISDLELKYQQLLSEHYYVKQERDKFAAQHADAKAKSGIIHGIDINCKLKKRDDPKDLALHLCEVDKVNKKTIVQLESELLMYKNQCRRQQEYIQQLNETIERTEVNNNTNSSKMIQSLQKQVLHLSNHIQNQSKAVQDYHLSFINNFPQKALADQKTDTSNFDFNDSLNVLKDIQKQGFDSLVFERLISKIEDIALNNSTAKSRQQILNYYYSSFVYLHVCQLADYCSFPIHLDEHTDNTIDSSEFNVNICVCSDKICFFNDGTNDIFKTNDQFIELTVNAIASISFHGNAFKIIIKDNMIWSHFHIVTKSKDDFNRLYYSLCYNGSFPSVFLNGCQLVGATVSEEDYKLPVIFYTKTHEILASLYYSWDLNALVVYTRDARFSPFLISCADYILNIVDNTNNAIFNYYSMISKCNKGYLYSFERYEPKDTSNVQYNEIIESFITTSTDLQYYLTVVSDSDFHLLEELISYGSWHDPRPELTPEDSLEHQPSDVQGDADLGEFKSQITLFTIADGKIYLLARSSEGSTQGIPIEKCIFHGDSEKNELSLFVNGTDGEREMFIFSLPTSQEFEYWKAVLLENNCNEDKSDSTSGDSVFSSVRSSLEHQQICIVTKNTVQMYKDYYDETSKPLLTFTSESTKVGINEVKREIIMETTSKDGNNTRIVLDCTNPSEFTRWKLALTLSGFIKTDTTTDSNMNGLKQYVFPIKLFDQENPALAGKKAFVVKANVIEFFVTPTAHDPCLIFKKSDIELLIYPEYRRIRIYQRRYTKNEERFDFTLPLMTDFSTSCAEFKAYKYKMSSGADTKNAVGDKAKALKVANIPFVLSRQGVITVHENMYTKEPKITIKFDDYSCNVIREKQIIQFLPKSREIKPLPQFVFKHQDSLKKWILALKVSGYLKFTTDKLPKLFFPSIIYGHITTEPIFSNDAKK